MSRRVLAAACLLLAAVPTRLVAEPSPALTVAQALVEAFNRHDPAAMAALVAPDFELFYVGDDGKVELATSGREALSAEMSRYFADRPAVRSEIAEAIDGPVYVSFREQIVGGASSLAVYEVRDGSIRRVWYFPAERTTQATPPLNREHP